MEAKHGLSLSAHSVEFKTPSGVTVGVVAIPCISLVGRPQEMVVTFTPTQ